MKKIEIKKLVMSAIACETVKFIRECPENYNDLENAVVSSALTLKGIDQGESFSDRVELKRGCDTLVLYNKDIEEIKKMVKYHMEYFGYDRELKSLGR